MYIPSEYKNNRWTKLFPYEICAALLEKKDISFVNNRFNNSIIIFNQAGVQCLYGNDADKFIAITIDKEDVQETSKLYGIGSYPGEITGIARVINVPEDMKKINNGEILISHSTSPDIVPAMEKAAGFVTDVGGLTCHASIVAREMKKPCIVGTKYATEIIKDGMFVKLDAHNGIVSILKKENKYSL